MTITQRVLELRDRIERTRSSQDVTLIAASKSADARAIEEAFEAGIRHFGENYLQEALAKRAACPPGITWHYIGRLQSNKVKRIGQAFSWLHTLDSTSNAAMLPPMDVLVEVNIAREPQKAGVLPEDLAQFVENVYHLPGLRFRGLMTMGPANRNPEDVRPYFIKMRELMDGFRSLGADCLSMGMSSDFDVAIQEGATHIRIGTGVFGPRTQ